MLSTRIFGLACGVAVFVCLMAAPVSAQPFDKRTMFTFSGPVTLPGITLPAGQYLFRLADPNSSARVVQVLNADGTTPYGLFFTIPVERLEPASLPEVRFMETASGTPAAIRTWWYPGERRGYEFIFPKEQARRLAIGASQPVLTTDAQTTTTEQTNTAELSRVGSSGQETDVSASAAPTATTPTRYDTRGPDCLLVPLNRDTNSSGRRQCTGPSVNGLVADPVDPTYLGANELSTAWFCASRSHAASAHGESASARRDGRHGHALECDLASVLAYTTTLNASTRAMCYVEGLDHSHDRAGGQNCRLPTGLSARPIARRAASDLLVTGRN